MRAFDHFLLTRFSAVMAPGAPPADEEWLWYRLGFFVDATHPSVAAQRGADYSWLVLLDDRCPRDFRDAIEAIAADGSFTPLWTHEPFRRDAFAGPVASRSDAPYLITTRLDSDDAVATDFMAAVRGQFAHQDRLFVSFTRGVQLDRSGAVYRCDQVRLWVSRPGELTRYVEARFWRMRGATTRPQDAAARTLTDVVAGRAQRLGVWRRRR